MAVFEEDGEGPWLKVGLVANAAVNAAAVLVNADAAAVEGGVGEVVGDTGFGIAESTCVCTMEKKERGEKRKN